MGAVNPHLFFVKPFSNGRSICRFWLVIERETASDGLQFPTPRPTSRTDFRATAFSDTKRIAHSNRHALIFSVWAHVQQTLKHKTHRFTSSMERTKRCDCARLLELCYSTETPDGPCITQRIRIATIRALPVKLSIRRLSGRIR